MHILIEPAITLPKLDAAELGRIDASAGGNTTILQTESITEMREFAPDVEVVFGSIYPEILATAPKSAKRKERSEDIKTSKKQSQKKKHTKTN